MPDIIEPLPDGYRKLRSPELTVINEAGGRRAVILQAEVRQLGPDQEPTGEYETLAPVTIELSDMSEVTRFVTFVDPVTQAQYTISVAGLGAAIETWGSDVLNRHYTL